MITLILIAYIIISLHFSMENMADNYYWGTEHKGMQKKEAIPIAVVGLVIFAGVVFLIGGSLVWIIQWIYENMP